MTFFSRLLVSLTLMLVALQATASAAHTFIFWLNGDANHLQHLSPTQSDYDDSVKKNDDQIRKFAASCNCNVVVQYDQRESVRVKKVKRGRVTSKRLSVREYFYKQGKLIREDFRAELNLTRPRVLTRLLLEAHKEFPLSQLHLVYRGHSFFHGSSRKKWAKVRGFDMSHKLSAYNYKKFSKSIQDFVNKSGRKLETVTFAACNMAYLEVAFELKPLVRFMIAPQLNILDQHNVGFNFDFLSEVENEATGEEVAHLIAGGLFKDFRDPNTYRLSRVRETTISLFDLTNIDDLEELYFKARELMSSLDKEELIELERKARVTVGSSEFAAKNWGIIRPVLMPGGGLDFSKTLQYLELDHADLLNRSVVVYDRASHSEVHGISIQFSKVNNPREE